jgi:parvulin-like peptidyl-prolyl isomerase
MTSEEMERAIEFLVHNQAKNTSGIMLTNEAVNKLAETVAQDRLENRALLEAYQRENREQLEANREQVEAYRHETREHIDNLIIANEVTRDLAEKVAKLAITTSQRVTALENK